MEKILDLLWKSYEVTDERRRKSFNALFSMLILIFFIWLAEAEDLKFPLLGTNLDKFIALAISPAIVLILCARYFYLSVNSFVNYTRYIKLFSEVNSVQMKKNNMIEKSIYYSFKYRDVSDILNIFVFPRRFNQENKTSLKNVVHCLGITALNCATLLTLIIPISVYILTLNWFWNNYENHISVLYGNIILFFYISLGLMSLFGFNVFIFRTLSERKFYKEKIDRPYYKLISVDDDKMV